MKMDKNKVNIGQVKEKFSAYVARAEKGQKTLVCRHNRPVAELVPVKEGPASNQTRLGSARGSVVVKTDLTRPAIPEKDWGALS